MISLDRIRAASMPEYIPTVRRLHDFRARVGCDGIWEGAEGWAEFDDGAFYPFVIDSSGIVHMITRCTAPNEEGFILKKFSSSRRERYILEYIERPKFRFKGVGWGALITSNNFPLSLSVYNVDDHKMRELMHELREG